MFVSFCGTYAGKGHLVGPNGYIVTMGSRELCGIYNLNKLLGWYAKFLWLASIWKKKGTGRMIYNS